MPFPYLTVASWVDVVASVVANLTGEIGALTDRQVLEHVMATQYKICAVLHIEDELYRSVDEWLGQIHGAVQPLADTVTLESLNVPVSGAADLLAIKGATTGVMGDLPLTHTHVDGLVTSVSSLRDVCDTILSYLYGGVPENPPSLATNVDTARILAALYYVANQVVVPAWSVDNTEVVNAIATAENALRDQADAHDDTTQGKLDSLGGSLVTIDGVVDLIKDGTDHLGTDTNSIIELLGEGVPTTGGGASGYPGSASVTQSIPRSFSGPLQHDEAMDGVIVHLTTIPAGTGKQTVNGKNSWQHMGWLAFLSDDGLADELQWLNLESAVYVPKRIEAPTGLLLFPRPGAEGTITPWVRIP